MNFTFVLVKTVPGHVGHLLHYVKRNTIAHKSPESWTFLVYSPLKFTMLNNFPQKRFDRCQRWLGWKIHCWDDTCPQLKAQLLRSYWSTKLRFKNRAFMTDAPFVCLWLFSCIRYKMDILLLEIFSRCSMRYIAHCFWKQCHIIFKCCPGMVNKLVKNKRKASVDLFLLSADYKIFNLNKGF